MRIEQHVTSLQLSQRLKELGLKRESLFYWFKDADCNLGFKLKWDQYLIDSLADGIPCEYYSAYLASELLELLPDMLSNEPLIIEIQKCKKEFHSCYGVDTSSLFCFVEEIFADTLAKILIRLIEQGHVSARDL